MLDCCPHCGGSLSGDADLVATWRLQCEAQDLPLIAGRVSERTAAGLLGMSERKLAELRKRGCGPVVTMLPVAGSRFSYDLAALARFAAAHRIGDDWLESFSGR